MNKDLKEKIIFIIKAHKKNFVWNIPDKFEEEEEFYSYPEKFFENFDKGKLVKLNESVWSKLKNTDSYNIKNIEEARNMSSFYKRDIDRILSATSLPAPTVVKDTRGKYILVAGNTRLMVSRAFKITPEILLIDLSN